MFYHSFMKIKVYSVGDLPLEETFTLHNVIILVRSVF